MNKQKHRSNSCVFAILGDYIYLNLSIPFLSFIKDKIIIVIIMHNVPSSCGISKGTRNHNTDKKAADKGSTEDSTLASVG